MRDINSNKGIDIWYSEIVPKEKDAVESYKALLDVDEWARMDKFSTEQLRQRYLCVRGRLRLLLAEYAGIRPENIHFQQGKYGKPFLPDHAEITFNISHSGNKLAVVVGHQYTLGIDIEFWRDKVDFSALVEKCFAEVERSYWHDLPLASKKAVFYEFWTKKESFVKAVGRGIALGMEQCVISTEKPEQFYSVPKAYGPPSEWKIFTLQLGDDISGAVSVRNYHNNININYF